MKVVQDTGLRVRQVLSSFKRFDTVRFEHKYGILHIGQIFNFTARKGANDGFLVIRSKGKYFHNDTSIYVDFTSKINNKTEERFFTIEKI